MAFHLNWEEELKHFENIWCSKNPPNLQHTKQIWDARADEWEANLTEEGEYRERSDRRIHATVKYLAGKGLLEADRDVIDIGCGPGRFVGEFAKTARQVVGTDLSPKMLEYAARYAAQIGVTNTSYLAADFREIDLKAEGWYKKFDLVFSSITPAISGMDGLERMMAISRGFCFNSGFAHSTDELLSKIRREVFGLDEENFAFSRSDGFYALWNILWLKGYYPECTYYTEATEWVWKSPAQAAAFYGTGLAKETGDATAEQRILQYLCDIFPADKPFSSNRGYVYGWLLWDVNRCDKR